MTQTAAHRLVTEAAAAATYRTAAQVTTEATAQAAAAAAPKLATATYTAEKGAANGIATLGSDGKVPTAQLPPAAASPLLGVYKANNTQRSTTTLADDPDLGLTVLTGTYWVEVEGILLNGSFANNLLWTLGGTASFTSPANATVYSYGTIAAGSTSVTKGSATPTAQPGPSTNGYLGFRFAVPIVVTAGGTLTFMWAPNSSNTLNVIPGSRMRAQKLA
jgi:hypothetical protein